MNEQFIKRIIDAYGLAYQKILTPQTGYRNSAYPILLNDGTTLNLILYKNEPAILQKIRAAHAVSDFLAGQGFPTRRAMASILRIQNKQIVKYAGLYNYLPGETIPWEAYTKAHLKLLGKSMSDMHAALRQSHYRPPTSASHEALALNSRMQRYFAKLSVRVALAQKLSLALSPTIFDTFQPLLGALDRASSQQPLHMDFVRGNILFEGVQIVGILDFEKTARGPVEYDLARTLAFLLVDCRYKPEAKIRKYFLQSGYIKRGGGTVTNPELLEQLISFFLYHDFYKFLRHNPYESLSQNEHFMRTRAILLQRGLIRVK